MPCQTPDYWRQAPQYLGRLTLLDMKLTVMQLEFHKNRLRDQKKWNRMPMWNQSRKKHWSTSLPKDFQLGFRTNLRPAQMNWTRARRQSQSDSSRWNLS